MIFVPYDDELEVIQDISKYNDNEYSIIRLTKTMLSKNIIDANILLRNLLSSKNIVDYNLLKNGGANGNKQEVTFLNSKESEVLTLNFYRVNNNRADPRFSIYKLNTLVEKGLIAEGDLLYISTVQSSNNENKLILINTTKNSPTIENIRRTFGFSPTSIAVSKLIPKVREIAQAGFHPNYKGAGKIKPKDVGETLEDLLGIRTNNSSAADFEDLIEIKAKTGKTLDTLFTLRPNFEGTPISRIEPNDRFRVSAFTRKYGYNSSEKDDVKNLYVTIGNELAPQNKVGLFLKVNENIEIVEIRHKKNNSYGSQLVAYWSFEELKSKLHEKHPATLWVEADSKIFDEDFVHFRYHRAFLSREPKFAMFLSLIESGGITYDWRGHVSATGRYSGKNKGNAWRIKKKYRGYLFGEIEEIELF